MTPRQRIILRHALGLTRESSPYRNHYVTGPGAEDFADCEALVAAGLMRRYDPSELSGGDYIYVVTEAGREALREPAGARDA